MKTLEISGKSGRSTILIGEELVNLFRYIPASSRLVIITDSNVWQLYQHQFPDGSVVRIGTGEAIKNLDTVRQVYAQLMTLEVDRSSFIVGIGGGIVCDIAGFVASTYLRGLRFGFVPTTLLAQVDASVGGKNGVNFGGYKNMIGVFNQPEFVLCDMTLLKTLPEKELLSGFSEIIKHAAIGDPESFEFLENHHEGALKLEPEAIEQLIHASIILKASVVNRDETEQGERRKLNFGHTFGHAIEKTTAMTHGEAVALGMVAACRLSQKKGVLSKDAAIRVTDIIRKLNLPVHIQLDRKKLLSALRKDKKREDNHVFFVMLQDVGQALVQKISLDEIDASINELI
jgi:3-dehydroquinate synthase